MNAEMRVDFFNHYVLNSMRFYIQYIQYIVKYLNILITRPQVIMRLRKEVIFRVNCCLSRLEHVDGDNSYGI